MLLSQHAEEGGAGCQSHVDNPLENVLVMHSVHACVIGWLRWQQMRLQPRCG